MKPVLSVVIFGIALFVVVVAMNTLRFGSKQLHVAAAPYDTALNQMRLAQHLAGALRFETVTGQPGEEFRALHQYLEDTFPRVHTTLMKEAVENYSLLYTWTGTDPNALPVLLLAHLDVVPVESGTEDDWTYPPFEGRVADGYVWGRGALDVKVGVVGILDAVEALLADGFHPRRTIYLALGHDEESGGRDGAANIAALLQARGIEVEYVLDEGLAITEGIMPGVSRPVALIGIAEKGKVALELTAQGAGGHASMPSLPTAIGILSTAIHNLERHQPSPSVEGPARALFRFVGPEMSLPKRVLFANTWLFGPLIKRKLVASSGTNALIRTTMATTMTEAGVEEDLVATTASAVVNVRILPGDSIAGVVERVRTTIDDTRVTIRVLEHTAFEPSGVSDIESETFATLQRTIHEVFPDVLVAPSLALGRTDTRHYDMLTRSSFRFLPMRVGTDDLARIHGTDERIAVDNYEEIVRFYARLIRNSDGG
jgi:carboxypeptidase PM20D1